MIIQKIELINFRNYERLSVDLSERLNLITGNNAQGKTNLLESLVFLSMSRSHRLRDDRKLIRKGCEFASMMCAFKDEEKEHTLKAIIHAKGKTLMKDGHLVSKSSEFIGSLNTILFSPDDLGLFSDSPKERRKVLNQEITKVSYVYLNAMSIYQNHLKQRNSVLKNENQDDSLLDIMDEQMAEEESLIFRKRKEFIEYINSYLGRIYQMISDEQSDVSIYYSCCYEKGTEEEIKERRQSDRRRDKDFHVTTSGIHKDDMIFMKDGQNVLECASQGQKRMIMLAFKMSLLLYIRKETGERPVLLLDDVLSELDHDRQKKLLQIISDRYQCVITATEIPACMADMNYREIHIENGMVKSIKEEVK